MCCLFPTATGEKKRVTREIKRIKSRGLSLSARNDVCVETYVNFERQLLFFLTRARLLKNTAHIDRNALNGINVDCHMLRSDSIVSFRGKRLYDGLARDRNTGVHSSSSRTFLARVLFPLSLFLSFSPFLRNGIMAIGARVHTRNNV